MFLAEAAASAGANLDLTASLMLVELLVGSWAWSNAVVVGDP